MNTEPNIHAALPEQRTTGAAFQRIAADLYETLLPSIAPKRHAGMQIVLADGGWLEAVARVDGAALPRVVLVLVSADGKAREEMASIYVPDLPLRSEHAQN